MFINLRKDDFCSDEEAGGKTCDFEPREVEWHIIELILDAMLYLLDLKQLVDLQLIRIVLCPHQLLDGFFYVIDINKEMLD